MVGQARDRVRDRGRDDAARFSTATRLRLLGEQTAERVYRSQNRRQARRSRLTGRAALLALVVCTLIVALAYPMRQYVAQRGEIADLQRRQRQAKERVDKLRDQKARWQDNSYAEQQIRERLHMVMPGETGYILPDPHATESSHTDKGAADRPWYSNVWDSVDKADSAQN
ncbi:FtsB family cell division protein [Streptomyces beihaiensis]|uniref:Septum formation initiator family protein n=1 Tax=Streptomyces beihaiensis TaxID=2984495 RepID=A0ABT3U299_9ACTN|nr:septum formation initiator family protein [Streptomyces beihaiensis]MCX3063437.1 septum formation initiator family protein [Streptomyces beihaiensis]